MELCPEPLWSELCRADPGCTFYQTPEWLGIGARHYRAEVAPLLLQAGETPICLPLLKTRRWGSDRYFSPFGTYAAPICARLLARDELRAVAQALRGLNVLLISSPFTPNAITVGRTFTSRIQTIDLDALDPENPMRDWDQGQRRRVRVALRNQVRTRAAEAPADWDRYYALYELSLQRWGARTTAAYPRALFDDIRRKLGNSPALRLWVAEHQGVIGSGYLTFYHNRHVVLWHGAADEHYFSFGVSQILLHDMILDARRRGFAVFDLTGSSGLEGVQEFKRRFGTHPVEFPSSLQRVGSARFLGALGDGLRALRRRWKRTRPRPTD